MDITSIWGAAAADVAAIPNVDFFASPWGALLPIIINGALLAYFFGVLSQRIRSLEDNFSNMREEMVRIEERVRILSISMAEVKANVASLNSAIEKSEGMHKR